MATEAISEVKNDLPYGGVSGTLEIDRDMLLNMLSEIVKRQHFKIIKGRIRDAKNEKIRLENVRVLAYICSVYNGILKDRDLTDIERRLEALENANDK
jgi:hypothetical protein